MISIEKPFVYEEKVLSSRFIGILHPLLGVDFPLVKAEIASLYPKASHYCHAYKKGGLEGSSDDGEPPRSAGLPLLQILRGSGLDEIALFVVRYFGGTKLGLPRLAFTYREVGKKLLAKAPRVEFLPGERRELELAYPDYGRFLERSRRTGLRLGEASFGTSIRLLVEGDATILEAVLADCGDIRTVSRKETLLARAVENDQGK